MAKWHWGGKPVTLKSGDSLEFDSSYEQELPMEPLTGDASKTVTVVKSGPPGITAIPEPETTLYTKGGFTAATVTIGKGKTLPDGTPPFGITREGVLVGRDKDGKYYPIEMSEGPPGVPVLSGFGPPPYTGTPIPDWDALDEEWAARVRAGMAPAKREPQHLGFPQGGVELDIHFLLTAVNALGPKPFAIGAATRLKGEEMLSEFGEAGQYELYQSGYEWADRLVEGRHLMAYIEEGEP